MYCISAFPDELLKNEESSERIRLLTEKIKDIRKVYGELKSEVANIDRKRKRKQKRKREGMACNY
jgi:molecular chaperone GrpE (heat shock protein)